MKKIILMVLFAAVFATSACAESNGSELLIRQALASGRPTMVDFGASYCIPCKKMKPILDSLKKEYSGRASVIFVDLKEERGMPEKYRIQMMPTQVFFDAKGKEVKRHLGFMDKPEILAVFKELGVK
ncbi:MAG: thioredoxin family protein [Geobacteraceae bacterium]|nr:thioredoxin family protein [Geobacteraceae bacterium]